MLAPAAVLAMLAGILIPATANAAIGEGATIGTWTTSQQVTVGSDVHDFTYDYTVAASGGQKKFDLQKACHTGPATTGYTYKAWTPLVATSVTASSTLTSSSGFTSMAGKGLYQSIASSLSSGTTCITKGTPAASGWGPVYLNFSATEANGRWIKTWIGSGSYPYSGYSSQYDLATNIPPAPPTEIDGSFSMDFSCTSSVNTAYSSHWTWYYTITGTNPSWTLTTTNLVKNSETPGSDTDLGFASNPHVVNYDVINFSWTSGPAPGVDFSAIWGSGIYCEDPSPLIANF